MLILTIRTDKPEAEIGLYDSQNQLAYEVWEAHRELAETIHSQIAKLLQNNDKNWRDIEAIVVFRGPGSFTGLRIGISLANALAYGLNIPIVATQNDWIERGLAKIKEGKTDKIAVPEYGAPVHITKPKK